MSSYYEVSFVSFVLSKSDVLPVPNLLILAPMGSTSTHVSLYRGKTGSNQLAGYET